MAVACMSGCGDNKDGQASAGGSGGDVVKIGGIGPEKHTRNALSYFTQSTAVPEGVRRKILSA